MVKTVPLYKKLFFNKSLKSKKEKLLLTPFFMSVEKYGREIQKNLFA